MHPRSDGEGRGGGGLGGGVADGLLRPALEAAVAVAREGEEDTPAIPAPPPLRPYLKFSKLRGPSLAAARRVLDADEEFRARVAEAADEDAVGRPGWLFLTRPDGWEDELEAIVSAVAEEAGQEADRRAEHDARRRLAGAEEAARRAEQAAEVARREATQAATALAEERRDRLAAAAAAESAQRRVESLAAERDRVRASAAAAAAEAGNLRRRVAELEARVQDLEAEVARAEAEPAATRPAPGTGAAERTAASGTGGSAGGGTGAGAVGAAGAGVPAGGVAATGRAVRTAAGAAARPAAHGAGAPAGAGAESAAATATGWGVGTGLTGAGVDVGRALREAAVAARQLADSLAAAAAPLISDEPAQVEAEPSPAPVPPPLDVAPARRRVMPPQRQPVPLPPAIFDDSVEAAEHLCRVSGVAMVVDGYNVSQTGWPELSIAEQRRRLVAALGELAARSGADVRVVFDGADMAMPGAVPTTSQLVRVTFSPPGVEADDEVLAMVNALPAHRPVVVATSDRAVQTGAARSGANVITSFQLLALLGR